MFVQDATLLGQIQSALAVPELDAGTPWQAIAHYANIAAYGQIRAALARRGFSAAQIDAWDDGEQYQLDLGLFWALSKAGSTKDYDRKFIESFDRRKELATVFVTTGGVAVSPATPRVAVGSMAQTVDIFSLDDRDLWAWQLAEASDDFKPAPVFPIGGEPWQTSNG